MNLWSIISTYGSPSLPSVGAQNTDLAALLRSFSFNSTLAPSTHLTHLYIPSAELIPKMFPTLFSSIQSPPTHVQPFPECSSPSAVSGDHGLKHKLA